MSKILVKSISEISQEDIILAKQNETIIHIPSALLSTTKWDEFISHCDYLFKNPSLTLPSPVKVVGALQMWDDYFVAGYYLENGNCFSQMREVKDITSRLYGRENDNGCTLINFVGGQDTIPIHTDTRDSFLWQAIGSVEWRIHESVETNSDYEALIVNPGDMLFVPSGVIHTVFCENPRAGMSIFYDKQMI